MDTPLPNNHIEDLSPGWALIDHFKGPSMTILEFGRDGRFGPRVTAIGLSFEQALAYGRDRMLLYDERDRQRGIR